MVSAAINGKPKGRTSRFTGEKGDFLDAMAEEFLSASDRGSFYSLAATRYVQKFGYAVYGASPDLAKMEPADKVAELERRKKFLPWLRTTLGGWFRHKYGRGRTDQSTLNKILLAMKDISQQRPTKPKILHRYSQVHYKDRIKPNFDAFWAEQEGIIPKSQRLAVTQDFVQKSWVTEPPEFRTAFEDLVEAEYQESLKSYNRRMDYSRTTPQAKLDAWNTIDSVVPNIADALGEWVGGSIHIDIVVPLGSDGGEIHLKSVQSRLLDPDNEEDDSEVSGNGTQLLYAEWDPEADKNHKSNLVKYGTAVFSEKERTSRIIVPECHDPVPAGSNDDDNDNDDNDQSGLHVRKRKFRASIASESAAEDDNVGNVPPRKRRSQVRAIVESDDDDGDNDKIFPPKMRQQARLIRPPQAPTSADTGSSINSSSSHSHPTDQHRSYSEEDVKLSDDGLYHFKDNETIVAIAKAAVRAAGGSYSKELSAPPSTVAATTGPNTPSPLKRTATAQFLLDLISKPVRPESSPKRDTAESGTLDRRETTAKRNAAPAIQHPHHDNDEDTSQSRSPASPPLRTSPRNQAAFAPGAALPEPVPQTEKGPVSDAEDESEGGLPTGQSVSATPNKCKSTLPVLEEDESLPKKTKLPEAAKSTSKRVQREESEEPDESEEEAGGKPEEEGTPEEVFTEEEAGEAPVTKKKSSAKTKSTAKSKAKPKPEPKTQAKRNAKPQTPTKVATKKESLAPVRSGKRKMMENPESNAPLEETQVGRRVRQKSAKIQAIESGVAEGKKPIKSRQTTSATKDTQTKSKKK